MDYRPFHLSRIGAEHIRRGLPCQDASISTAESKVQIAAVADGHGSRRHFRSERGSAIACRIATEKIQALFPKRGKPGIPTEEQLIRLKQDICEAWMEAVREDYEKNPWTEQELAEEQKLLTEDQFIRLTDGTDAAIAYGSTLCAVFTYAGGWSAIQLGDGGFTHISADGRYEWPMPESLVNEGNRTASLCMQDPMRDFRHCSGKDQPVGLLVFTDGIEKVFPPQGKEIVSLLHWIWRNEYSAESARKDNLCRTLDMLSSRSSIGDDASVAGLVDPEAEDAEPVAGQSQKKKELDRLYARLAEINSSMAYKRQQLQDISWSGSAQAEAREQVERILQRNREEASALQDQIAVLREALHMEPDHFQEPEPETGFDYFDSESDADPEEPYYSIDEDEYIWPENDPDEITEPEDPEVQHSEPEPRRIVKNILNLIRQKIDEL